MHLNLERWIFFTVHFLRAFFSASQPVQSFPAGLRAIGALPTPGADATSVRGITRTIVHAFAMRVTVLAVKTLRALCFASYSCYDVKAKPVSSLTIKSNFFYAIASLLLFLTLYITIVRLYATQLYLRIISFTIVFDNHFFIDSTMT